MLKIEKVIDGQVQEVSAEYEIENNILTKPTFNSSYLTLLHNPTVNKGCTYSSSNISYSYSSNLQAGSMIFQSPMMPFEYGTLTLRNKKTYDLELMSFYMQGTNKQGDFIGIADKPGGVYSSTSTIRGSYNVGESSSTYGIKNITHKMVFDFPFATGNGEINEISYYARPFYTNMNASTQGGKCGASNYNNGLQLYPKLDNSIYPISSCSSVYVTPGTEYIIVNQENKPIILKDGVPYVINKPTDILTDNSNLYYNTFFTMNNEIYLIGGCSHTTGSNNSITLNNTSGKSLKIQKVNSFEFNDENNTCDLVLSEEVLNTAEIKKPSNFYGSGNQAVGISCIFQLGDNIFMIIQSLYSSSYYNDVAVYKFNNDMTELLNTPVTFSLSSNSLGMYLRPFYDEKTNVMYIQDVSGLHMYELLVDDANLKLVTTSGKPFSITKHLYKLPGMKKLYGQVPINDIFSISSSYHSANELVYSFGEVKTDDEPIIKIKLKEPLVKTENEILKITLNVNLSV